MTLLELAERCEQATGPDLELEMAISRVRDAAGKVLPQLDYTRSIDAAMTLVPEDFDWRLGRTNSGLTIHAEVGGQAEEDMRFGATPALALCAAALRARAATPSSNTQEIEP